MEIQYKEFEVVGTRPDRPVDILKCSYFSSEKKGMVTLFKDGSIVDRSCYEEEEERVMRIIMDKKRPYINKQGEVEAGRYVNYEDFKFVPASQRTPDMDAEVVYFSKINEALYAFLQKHDHVIVKDKVGTNQNANCRHFDFEFIDRTQGILDSKRKHEGKIKAGLVLGEVYNRSKDEFVSLAYAMNIPAIDEQNLERLYNMMAGKIEIQPEFFLKLVEDENFGLISIVNKALSKNIAHDGSVKTVIETTPSGSYIFDGELIALNKEELIRFFKFNDAKTRHMKLLLGENQPKQADVELVGVSEAEVEIKETSVGSAIASNQMHENDKKLIFKAVIAAFKKTAPNRDADLLKLTEEYKHLDFYILERVNAERKRFNQPLLHELNFQQL